MHVRYIYLLLLLTLLLAACGGQGASEVTGTWTGTFVSGSSFTLQLSQNGSLVEGTAIVAGVVEFPGILKGSYTGGQLSLTGHDNVGAVSLEATVNISEMQGTYSAVDPATGQPLSLTFSASR